MRTTSRLPRAVFLLASLLPVACRDLPPSPDSTGAASTGPGGRPTEVYVAGVLHPAHRWFGRVFAGVGAVGASAVAAADAPLPRSGDLSLGHRAELHALLETLRQKGLGPEAPVVARRALASDLRLVAACLAIGREGDAEGDIDSLAAGHRETARWIAPPALPDRGSGGLVPPPLRSGRWRRVEGPFDPRWPPGHRDPRRVRILYRWAEGGGPRGRDDLPTVEVEVPEEAVLLFVRPGGPSPGRARSDLAAAECWSLRPSREGPVPSIWRLDRALLIRGDDPWRRIGPDDDVRIRHPLADRGAPRVGGALREQCASCHTPEAPLRSRVAGFSLPGGAGDAD